MTVSQSAVVKQAKLDAEETAMGTSVILRLYSGTIPTNADTALSGNTLLAEGTLPSDWMAAAGAAGNVVTKAKSGTWTLTGQSGAGAGTAATFYRIYASNGTTCHEQGSVTATGGGGDMTLDNNSIANAQSISVATFTKTAGN